MGAPTTLGTDRIAAGGALTIALCFGVMVIEGFDIQAMGVAAPKLGLDLKLSKEALGQALAGSNIGLVFGAIVGGWMADRLGRKPVLASAVVLFGVFTLMTMMSKTLEMLFAARLLTGLGFGAALPNIMAVAADVAPPEKRGSTSAMMFCGMPAGGSAVALLSWLQAGQANADWRTLFLIGGLMPLALAPALIVFMKETQKPVAEPGAPASALPWLAAIPIGLGAGFGLEQLNGLKGFSAIAGVTDWLGGVLGVLGAYMIVHRGPLFGGRRAKATILLWAVFFPTLVILYFVLNWLPTLVGAKGFPDQASLASVWFNLAGIVGAAGLGALVDRFGVRWPLSLGFLGLIGALIALAQATQIWPILMLSGAVGFFLLGSNYALYGAAAIYYPPEMRGRGSGAAIAWGRLGAVAGPLLGGLLLQGGASPATAVYAMAPFAGIAACGVLFLTYLTKSEG